MDEIMTEATEATEITEATEPAQEPEQQEAAEQPSTEQKPVKQSREVNHQFKLMRQQQERLQREMEQMQSGNAQLLEALKDYGYSGTAEEVLNQLKAAKEGISIDDYMERENQIQSRAKELMQSDPEYQTLKEKAEAYENMAFENVVKEDLAAIKKAFPEEKARTVDELGEQFIALRAQGIDPVVAYAAINTAKQATAKPKPPEMGAVGQKPVEKEFYTSEEIDKLTDKELDDPSIWAKVMKSMTKLGRH